MLDQCLYEHLVRTDDGLVLRKSSRSTNTLDTLLNKVCPVCVVLAEEGFQSCLPCTLDVLKRWPVLQEVAEDQGIPVFEPVQHLGVEVASVIQTVR